MKKLLTLCLLFVLSISVNAQDNGPTKEQTIEYIKSYFSDYKTGFRFEGVYRKLTANYSIEFTDCKMKISYDYYDWTDNTKMYTQVFEFNLNTIESLGVVEGKSSERSDYMISFTTVNKSKSILSKGESMEMLNEANVSVKYCSNCESDITQLKIYKAFNHLRKLCGAPEPISFD